MRSLEGIGELIIMVAIGFVMLMVVFWVADYLAPPCPPDNQLSPGQGICKVQSETP